MARPRKSVDTMSKNLTKEERENRKLEEERLKGGSNKINPPDNLTKDQRKFFRYIVRELSEANILTNLDVNIKKKTSICLDRIRQAEDKLNEDIFNKEALKVKDSYTKEFFRCCNELSLSPQSRAKLAGINLQAKANAEDPVIKALKGDDED